MRGSLLDCRPARAPAPWFMAIVSKDEDAIDTEPILPLNNCRF